MTVMKIDYSTFDELHTQCESARSQLQNTIDDMNANVNGKLAENWEGDGKLAYTSAQGRWNQAAHDLYQVLTDVEHSLDSCKANFHGMEGKIVNLF